MTERNRDDLGSDVQMQAYYRERAPVYDRVYAYPERQDDLRWLETYIPQQFHGLDVIEIAAGTGYWTQFIAPVARSMLATDATAEPLQQVKQREQCAGVPTEVIDAYSLGFEQQRFSAAFAGLWFSHVPKQRYAEFLAGVQRVLQPGATVLLIDNSIAQCQRLPLSYTDVDGNTFQERELDDGSVYPVLKNFPTRDELCAAIEPYGREVHYRALEHFWLFQYESC